MGHSNSLRDVVSAPNDVKALLVFLEELSVIDELSKTYPLIKARIRGILRKCELYDLESGCISAEEAQAPKTPGTRTPLGTGLPGFLTVCSGDKSHELVSYGVVAS